MGASLKDQLKLIQSAVRSKPKAKQEIDPGGTQSELHTRASPITSQIAEDKSANLKTICLMEPYSYAEAAHEQARRWVREHLVFDTAKCCHCTNWHLVSPEDAMTNSCPHCVGHTGKTKRMFPSEDTARNVANNVGTRYGQVQVYRCPKGYGWHLTSS